MQIESLVPVHFLPSSSCSRLGTVLSALGITECPHRADRSPCVILPKGTSKLIGMAEGKAEET